MSEGSNVPREPIKNRSWIHSEPANRTIRRLREQPDYFRQITEAARHDINKNARRVLTYSDETESEADPPAHVTTEREFTFGEIDENIIPAVPPNEANKVIRVSHRRQLPSNSSVSNLSQRGEFSLTFYESSIFDPTEINQKTSMADEPAAAPLHETSDDADFEFSQARDTLAGMPDTLKNPRPGPHRAYPDPKRYLRKSNTLLAHLDDFRKMIFHNQTRFTNPTRANPQTLIGAAAPEQYARTYSGNLPRKSLYQIPTFDGTSEEKLTKFLMACEYVFELIYAEEEPALIRAVICTKIKGPALTELKDRELTTLMDLRTILENCYVKKKSMTRLQREFNYLKQKQGEDARTFGNRVERLTTKLFEAGTEGTYYSPTQKVGLHHFIKSQALINF